MDVSNISILEAFGTAPAMAKRCCRYLWLLANVFISVLAKTKGIRAMDL